MSRRKYDFSMYPFSRRLETKRVRKRAEFRESISLQIEGGPDYCDLPHIYLPRLHRQKTEKGHHTKLGDALTKMTEDNDITDQMTGPHYQLSALQREVREFTDWIIPHLRKNEQLEFKQPFVIESFPPWRSLENVIPCLLPFAVRNLKLKPLHPGYVVVQLLRRSAKMDELCNLRANDGIYLSVKKTYQVLHKILRKAFHTESIPIERLRLFVKDAHYCIFYDLKNYGWTLEVIPAIYIRKSSAVLVSKPFEIGENSSPEMQWRICWGQKEGEIIRSISCTDKGVRLKALHIVCKLCQKDWRLNTLTPYQIQTALLFDIDHHIDYSPRWQRCSLEECVLSLLNRLLHFAKLGYLPHFIIEGVDLFRLVTSKTIILYKSALERLTNNEKALISLLERVCPDSQSDTQWMEPKPPRDKRAYGQIPVVTGIV